MDLSDFWFRSKSFLQFRQSRQLPGICSVKQFQTIPENERRRADRNQHQFSLVVFNVGRSDKDHIQIRYLAHVLRNRIRSMDRMGWLDNERKGIVLPYISAAGAWQFADTRHRQQEYYCICDTVNAISTCCVLIGRPPKKPDNY